MLMRMSLLYPKTCDPEHAQYEDAESVRLGKGGRDFASIRDSR